MRRRDLIKGIAGSAAAWPLAAHAQQPATPIVGFLRSTSLAPFQNLGVALGQGLKEAGFIEGQNVTIEYRYAENQIDRQPALSGRLDPLARGRDCSEHGRGVCGQCRDNDDPDCLCCWVKSGLVASLNRPGGNITGVSFLTSQVGPKRLELLRQVCPRQPQLQCS
jgi:putative tryptophan/tyrosine transport system substrate-binding protein